MAGTGYSSLPQASAGAFGSAMTGANAMAGATPASGGLPSVDMAGYMNPFQKNVTDTTMNELNRQEGIQGLDLAGQATAQGAFGGDRFGVQMAENNRNFDQQRASILAQLNSANFNNAQGMATSDLNRAQGANQFGIDKLGQLGQQGFQAGQTINNSNLAMGSLQQRLQQQLIDAARGQVAGVTNAPTSGLEQFLGSVLSPGNAGTTTTTSNPGKGGAISGIGSGISSIAPLFMK